MTKHVLDKKLWSLVNSRLNYPAMLKAIYGIDRIVPAGDTVELYTSPEAEQAIMPQSYGNALGMVSQVVDMTTFTEIVNKSYKTNNNDMLYVFNRFSDKDDANLIKYPLTSSKLLNAAPEYCKTLYSGKYDFCFSPANGFHDVDLVLYVDNIDTLMEDVTFMKLQDCDIGKICEYKILNMIPLDESVDEELIKQGEL